MIVSESDKKRAVQMSKMLVDVLKAQEEILNIVESGLGLCENKNERFTFEGVISSTNNVIQFIKSNKAGFDRVTVS